MPGTSLYELWKYYEGVRAILVSDLTEFRESTVHGTIAGFCCSTSRGSSQIPTWIDRYIESIGKMPHLFDLVEFNTAMSSHVKATDAVNTCECAPIPSQVTRNFWEALTTVVHDSFEKVNLVDLSSCLDVDLFTGGVSSISCARARGFSKPDQSDPIST